MTTDGMFAKGTSFDDLIEIMLSNDQVKEKLIDMPEEINITS